jgi:hypothetical protein
MDDSKELVFKRLEWALALLEKAGYETITHVDVWAVKDGDLHQHTVVLRATNGDQP